MSSRTATVEALTAEVRVLMIGSRQVAMSVYEQLDSVPSHDIEPFGRVRPKNGTSEHVYVVGRNTQGELVRSNALTDDHAIKNLAWHIVHRRNNLPALSREVPEDQFNAEVGRLGNLADEWSALPLIVLAGLR